MEPISAPPMSSQCREILKMSCSFRFVATLMLSVITVKSRRLGSTCSDVQKAKGDTQF
jgi:hypothetical protein